MGREVWSFTPAELYTLAGAAGVTYIFGLQEREILALTDEDCITKATAELKEKGLITENNGLTPAAFQLIELLRAYQESQEYTRINNLLIGFFPQDKDRVAVLTERKQNEEYEIHYIAKRDVYFSLLERIPFLMREPREIEDTFFTKKMTEKEQQTFEEMDLSEKDLLAIETVSRPRSRRAEDRGKWECFLYFTEGEDFIQIEVERKRYEWASLYAVNKKLYDVLKMPYKKISDPRQFSLGGRN
ncbi:DUF5081 domain-containing protein [Bacillus pseudomycoides]|uniref:DUF5081 family protein n=1 Tax=Bacillus pseudomycoides TaxID=64104 RepID=UPI000BF35910|nr:DUF5081 family protein [Bacillus pseudomycoides]PGB89870.1 DUF5081 domain-containing protein [Bacillus pseudomycoides]